MQPPPQRGSGTQPGAFTFAGPLQEEDQILEAALAAMLRGVLPEGAFERLFAAARRDERLSELAFAFESVSQGKRFKAAPPPVAATFLLQAADLFGEGLGDAQGAAGYAERALAVSPGHAGAFAKLDELLSKTGDLRKLADAHAAMAPHRPRQEQAPMLRRAAQLLGAVEGSDDRVMELLQQLTRLEPTDDDARRQLEALYLKANRPRDVVRMYEQAVAGDPPPDEPTRRRLLGRVVELYADALREPERALPYIEQLLAIDPTHDVGRAVAQRLVVVKGLAGRAASALVQAYEVHGTPQELARFLTIELESTRGPRRATLLTKLGRLRAERLHDDKGAFEAYDQALLTDASEDDLRVRYVALAGKMGRWLEAAKTFGRVVATSKDAATRASASAQFGEVLLRSGDPRRAKATLGAVLSSADAPPGAQLAAARALREILETERDPRALADVLERVATLEPDLEARREVDERLAELATEAGDSARAVAAYERLLETSARSKALAALAPLYEAIGDPVKHARLLEEQSKDTPDAATARELAMRAATIRAQGKGDPAAAIAACQAVVERFGAARDVLDLLVPLLEAGRAWAELAEALAQQAALAAGPERAAALARLGMLRLQRLRDVDGAIEAVDEALAFDASEKTARAMLERLTSAGDHRLQAARVLEPVLRRDGAPGPLLRLLELRGAMAQGPEERLSALREAVGIVEAHEPARAFDLAGRALAQAVASGLPLGEWLDRLDAIVARGGVAPPESALVLAAALGDREATSDDLSALAQRAARALAAAGDAVGSIVLYRKALARDPGSRAILEALDELLRGQGQSAERVGLHRAALEGAEPARRRELLRHIASIERFDLHAPDAAVATCLAALAEDDGDEATRATLAELYAETRRWSELCALLESSLERAEGNPARALRARLTEVASAQGDRERALRHGARLLEDPDLSGEHLAAVERASERLEDAGLARAVLVRRSEAAGDPAGRILWLERLGELDEERRGDLDGAAAAWKRAGGLAVDSGDEATARRLFARARRVAPDDRELTARLAALCERASLWADLPPLYGALVEQSAHDAERVDLLLRTAKVLEEHLHDVEGASRHAGRAFEIAPHRDDALAAFEATSLAAGATEPLERAIDEALARTAHGDEGSEPRVLLQLARARVLARDPERVDDAAIAHRALLSDPEQSDTAREQALAGFTALIDRMPATAGRLEDRRWLLEWRAGRSSTEDRGTRLLEWATFEEQTVRDPVRALALYRRVLEVDPASDSARASVARLALATGDTDEALEALRGRRDRAEGSARSALELEMAQVLLERTTRWQDALDALRAVLQHSPDDPVARTLATQLVAHRATRAAAVAMLEQACAASADPRVKEQILARLLDAPADADDADARKGWFERLADLQRSEGEVTAALLTAARAAREMPDAPELWDRAEELSRALSRPDEVASLYEEVLGRSLGTEATLAIGERAVQFYEEWFEDRTRVARVLERVLELDPNADWAFDRLKLLLDSSERWDDLFQLYDRALERAEGRRKIALLEEAVQTAKDFADRPDRAIGYLERLRDLRPGDPKLASALERLYERQGRHRELVTLLSARLPSWKGDEERRGRVRMALLWLDDLGDPAQALDVLEPLLMRGDGREGDGEVDVWALLERVLAAAPATVEAPRSTRPPASGSGARAAARSRRSEPPVSTRRSVRAHATALLRSHYAGAGRAADLARVLTLELESIRPGKERGRRHVELAVLHEQIGDLPSALDHLGAAFVLDPDDDDRRAKLEALAEATGRHERLAELLASSADASEDPRRRIALTMAAAVLRADRTGNAAAAIDLLWNVTRAPGALPDEVLAAARRLIPLLEGTRRDPERLEALQQVATLESDPRVRREILGAVARLGAELGQADVAIGAWEARVQGDPGDLEALDGLVELLARERRSEPLVAALTARARAASSDDRRRADLAAAAVLLGESLSRPEEAIRAWREIERDFGEADDSALALAELLRRVGLWSELAELLERRVSRAADPATRAELLRLLADVQHERLGDVDLAMTSYERALGSDPRSAGARAGLLAVAPAGEPRRRAIAAVLRALRTADDWRGLLDLTPLRIDAAQDVPAQIEALEEAAKLSEARAGEPAAAFDALRRAFLLAPGRDGAAAELARVAESASLWRELADAYRTASDAVGTDDVTTASRLRAAMGEVLERRLGDEAHALDAYVLVAHDTNAADAMGTVVRLAGRLGYWSVATRAVVEHLRSGAGAAHALDALERATETSGAWLEATGALEAEARSIQLPAATARDLDARRGVWLRDRVGDAAAAEAAFASAVSHDPGSEELLGSLAALQRAERGARLVDTLTRLSTVRGGDLGLLREAAETAGDVPDAEEMARSALLGLLSHAEERARPEGDAEATRHARWSIERLATLAESQGDWRAQADVLSRGEALPIDAAARADLRRRAARVSLDRVGDHDRAIAIYLSMLADDPHDEEASTRLAETYVTLGRRRDLLTLRERQIAATPDEVRRVSLRLEAASLLVSLGEPGLALETLRSSLVEAPVHLETVEALAALLESEGAWRELRELLADQAQRAEVADPERAALCWRRAAAVAEERLRDPRLAETLYQRTAAFEPSVASLDALARLCRARGDPAAAAGWLDRMVEVVQPEERVVITLRLADALLQAGDGAGAVSRLERALASEPDAAPVRERLAALYREQRAWSRLAALIGDSAEHAPDGATRLARLVEAAELYAQQCADPERAVALLEKATELAPDDPHVRLDLAGALATAGRFEPARAILQGMLEAFGARRPKERAPVHYQIARLELSMGNRASALAELDAATRIDPQNPDILRTLAALARDDGQLDRAEKSYRALLAVLRRRDGAAGPRAIARSEILLELSTIATQQDERERALEILESALEAAAESDFEQDRLESALRARGEAETLVRVLEGKLSRGGETTSIVKTLGQLGEVLAGSLGRPEQALSARLRAVMLDPRSPATHDAALALARTAGGLERYLDCAARLAEEAVGGGDTGLASALLLRLGDVAEHDLHDDRRAATWRERALAQGVRTRELLRSLDGLYERLGDTAEHARVLAIRIELDAAEGGPAAASDALYRLAALRLADRATVVAGVETLRAALDVDPQPERADPLVKRALERDPANPELLAIYEHLGRQPGREQTLVDALRLRAELPGAEGATLRDAVEVATTHGEPSIAEALLERVVGREPGEVLDAETQAWALVSLANLRAAAGDLRRAVELKRAAARVSDPEVARRLELEAARTAAGELCDQKLAAEVYALLHDRDPADREAWEPLAAAYRALGDVDRLVALLERVVDYVDDLPERGRLRLERVRAMTARGLEDAEAAPLLREIVDEDPGQVEAARLLAAILERTGREQDLTELLSRQIDAAKDRSDAALVASLALRLGDLQAPSDRIEARNVYYVGLDWEPRNRGLLAALLRLLEGEEDATAERTDVLERQLAAEQGPAAEAIAVRLAELRTEQGDEAGALRALELGFRAHPASVALRDRLETALRAGDAWAKLADLCVADAGVRSDLGEQVARLREAASIRREKLHDPRGAADALLLARQAAPDDLALARELVEALVSAGDVAAAVAELSRSLEHAGDPAQRATILAARAQVHAAAGSHLEAVADLEGAFAIDRAAFAAPLADALDLAREAAEQAGDAGAARDLRLRIARTLPYAGEIDEARSVLGTMLEQDPADRVALRTLASLESALEHWDGAVEALARLAMLEEEPATVISTALALADACERTGRLGDARDALERARDLSPLEPSICARLEAVYEQTGCWHELADLVLARGRGNGDAEDHFAALLRAGEILMNRAGDSGAAVPLLDEARAARPNDPVCIALTADALTLTGQPQEAFALLEQVIAPMRTRRLRELAPLHVRQARAARALGDPASEHRALSQALECDSHSGEICAEVAIHAMELEQLDLAGRALRAVTLLKTPGPMSKGLAYQYMGEIARRQGDPKRALMLLKRALSEDPTLEGARALVDALEAS